jgi:beta-lactam-binding protein with PASTA domain
MIKGIFQFLKSKTFFINLGIYVLFLGLLFWLLITWLGSYTNHDKTILVPNFSKIKIADLDQFISGKNIRYVIIDSLYDEKAVKGSVIRQEPQPNMEVKEGRIIYLYVTSTQPPSVQMPKLIDRSLRQAATMITTYGFKMGQITYVPDQCANCVLDQLVKGKSIAPGANIAKGTVINLVVGKGLGDEEVGIPCLSGLARKEALEQLAEASLSIGAIKYDNPKDSAMAKVYRQIPGCSKKGINIGSSVDLFLTADATKLPQADSTSTVTPQ